MQQEEGKQRVGFTVAAAGESEAIDGSGKKADDDDDGVVEQWYCTALLMRAAPVYV